MSNGGSHAARSEVNRGQLPRLTSLRVFAALAVFVFHVGKDGIGALPGGGSSVGYAGVAFFFVLSGFVLAWGTRPGLPARTFWRRRFARVWPAHAVMLAVAALVPVVPVARTWAGAAANALLLQAWFTTDPITYGMNAPAWSLSAEAFFYLTFPLAAWILARLSGRLRWAAAGAALLLELAAAVVSPQLAFHIPLLRLPEFLLGVVAGLAFRDGWRPRVPTWAAWLAVAVGVLVSVPLPVPFPDVVLAVPFLAALLAAAGRDTEARRGWLQHPALIFAGEASFAFYLTHELVIVNLRGHLTGAAWIDALIVLLVAAVAAVGLHLAVERPMNRLIRGRSRSVALALPS